MKGMNVTSNLPFVHRGILKIIFLAWQDLADIPEARDQQTEAVRRSEGVSPDLVLPSPFALVAEHEAHNFRSPSPDPGINSQLQGLTFPQALSGLSMPGGRSATFPLPCLANSLIWHIGNATIHSNQNACFCCCKRSVAARPRVSSHWPHTASKTSGQLT